MDARGGSLCNECWGLDRVWAYGARVSEAWWPQDGLCRGQAADWRAGFVRNRMSGFGEVGSGRVTRSILLIRSHQGGGR